MDCVKNSDGKTNITDEIKELDSPLDNDKLPKTQSDNNVCSIQDCDTKHKLKDYINGKKRKLDQSKRILELKYARYKYCNDFWNIGTIKSRIICLYCCHTCSCHIIIVFFTY